MNGADVTMETLPVVLTVDDLAEALKIGHNAAYSLVRSGKIRVVRIGKNIRIPQAALMEYLSSTD
jgi:excisionase family DNA binding protein